MNPKLLFLLAFLSSSLTGISQTTLHTESFETDGEGVRYNSNTFNTSCDLFERTNNNGPYPCFQDALSNLQGTFFWVSEDVIGPNNPSGPTAPARLDIPNISIAGFSNLQVSLYMAISRDDGTRWDLADFITIQARIDAGSYVTVGQFVGDDAFVGDLRQDTDLDGVANAGAPTINTTFTQYTFNISGVGSTMDLRVEVNQDGGSEEFAFDLVVLQGTAILPVKLSDFRARRQDAHTLLSWQTTEEINHAYFAVERSEDGQAFAEIGRVDSAPQIGAARLYEYQDAFPGSGTQYYRLRQVDLDGSFAYSQVRAVQGLADAPRLRLYPNPSRGELWLDTPQPLHTLEVFAVQSGRRVAYFEAEALERGKLDLSRLAAGAYLLVWQWADGQQGQEKWMLLR